MSEPAYRWGHEHFCEPDVTTLYETEPERLNNPALRYPVKLDAHPEPETFCSTCLKWFSPPHPEGSEHRPPTQNGDPDA